MKIRFDSLNSCDSMSSRVGRCLAFVRNLAIEAGKVYSFCRCHKIVFCRRVWHTIVPVGIDKYSAV